MKKADFREHAFDMADTAVALAKSGLVTDKAHADELVRTAKKVQWLPIEDGCVCGGVGGYCDCVAHL